MMNLKCNICNKKFTGYGNKATPVKHDGLCCNKCYNEIVIPTSYEIAGLGKNYVSEVIKEYNGKAETL